MNLTEQRLREELAACYRLIAHFRMTDLIDTHITARVPGPEHHFLINRYGVLFHEMRASDLVKIDRDGRVVEAADRVGRGIVLTCGYTLLSLLYALLLIPSFGWPTITASIALLGALVASFLVNDSPGPVALAGLTAVLSLDGGLVHRALAMPVLRRLAPPVAEALPQEP